MNYDDPIALLVRRRRAARQWNQLKLATEAGLSVGTIANLERFGFITKQTAERISRALDIPVEQLLDAGPRSAPGGRP